MRLDGRSLHEESLLHEERSLQMERFLCAGRSLCASAGRSLRMERPRPLSSPAALW